ncbi:MAG: ribonuclease H-like domain-containing protein [candidate division KSB1 bacterium]|nr:ribonuclease H-like domain-containing protein [candidate division KSB1 bacterium]MDZ7346094.1 ribonuclease H-like domain-containing protein [candidate division KSB1 bacterium]
MQSLKEKLRELRSAKTGIEQHPASAVVSFQPVQPAIDPVEKQSNKLLIRNKSYPLSFFYGNVQLSELALIDSNVLSFMAGAKGFENLTAQDLLFIDTETTGVAGGTGTYVFLIGIGRLDGDEFVVKQLLMNDFCHEEAFLEAFSDEIAAANCLITYNGKSFDLPLIKTRLLLNRKETRDLELLPHIDLLIPVRRLWKKSLPSCALADVEANILRYNRVNDIPGWAIPQVYFDYLRSQDFQEILHVLRHNVQDILSLAALSAYLGRVSKRETNLSHVDPLWMFRIYCQLGKEEDALQFLPEAPVSIDESTSANERLLLEKALLLKRMNRFRESNMLFEQLLSSRQLGKIACIELAKFYEHKAKDYRKALELMIQVEKRYEMLSLLVNIDQADAICDYEWERRKLRLRQKINQASW